MADEKITMHRVTDEAPGRCASCATSVGRWVDAERVEIKAHLVCSSCLAALAEAQRERDEERRKVEALLLGDKALQPRIWLGEEVQRLKAELADLSNLLDQTMAARDQLRQERNAAAEESRLMRPVVEKAREWRHTPVAGWRSADGDEMALVAAVDTYEKQTGGTE